MINAFLILKNDRFFRLFETFFNKQGISIAGTRNDLPKAKDSLNCTRTDVVIMDANWFMHESHTLKVLSGIVRDNPQQKIILVTTSYEPRFEKLAIASGAHGYFYRAAGNMEAITNCIRKVAGGVNHFPAENYC